MAPDRADVVIVGGGIAGIATAYYLGIAGVRPVVVERDSVGSHASGFAYGGLNPLGGAGTPGPVAALAKEGMRLHTELATRLPEVTGVNTEYRVVPALKLAFTGEEVEMAQADLEWQRRHEDCVVEWLDGDMVRGLEPRLSGDIVGAVRTECAAEVEPYRFVLALTQAAEKLGATVRHGRATGLKLDGDRVRGVELENGQIPCDRVVLAMGPWTGECSSWLGLPMKVGPLKGQILRMRAPGTPFRYSLWWAGNYATTKPDGLLWAGTTEEHVGFSETPTPEARDSIMEALLKMVPVLADAQLVQQTACLRPLSADLLPVLGPVPGVEGVYMATGAGRSGILLGPAMGRVTADLVTRGATDLPIEAFDPGRFGR